MKKFHLTDSYALINFDAAIYDSEISILQTKAFENVLRQFVKKLRFTKDPIIEPFKGVTIKQFLDAYKVLFIYPYKKALKNFSDLYAILKHRTCFYEFTEGLYDHWRNIQRFGLMASSRLYHQDAKTPDLIVAIESFNEVILSLYRKLSTNLLGENFHVFRQLPAGVNANLLYVNHRFSFAHEYTSLQNIAMVSKIVTRPPFIAYTKSNVRHEFFHEVKDNPLKKLKITKLHYFTFPIKVGPLLAFVYVHRNFLHQGIALSNLFELVSYDEIKNKKPDIVYLYGIEEEEFDCSYYHDHENEIYLGFVSRNNKNDYFGYLKKMLLTLHNLYMIDSKRLPIHGAMVNVLLKNNETKNIVVIGDSGAGKSETLEALRLIGKDYIREMKIVFDDMGTFLKKDNQIYAIGTEIGAFVRLDDLDVGYAYQKIDRAIFLNPDQVNARVVLPVTTYQYIMQHHKVDLLLYANNYLDTSLGVRFISNQEEAIDVFRQGQRYAKGTTSEVGLVSSYFANPFGPLQKKEATEKLLVDYFQTLFNNKVIVGELYTNLAINGKEKSGPLLAATILLEHLVK